MFCTELVGRLEKPMATMIIFDLHGLNVVCIVPFFTSSRGKQISDYKTMTIYPNVLMSASNTFVTLKRGIAEERRSILHSSLKDFGF